MTRVLVVLGLSYHDSRVGSPVVCGRHEGSWFHGLELLIHFRVCVVLGRCHLWSVGSIGEVVRLLHNEAL